MSAHSIMGERIESLNRVARGGDIDAFYHLIREDVKILEDIDALPFVDTPLHIIASAEPDGPVSIKFAMEMMRLKPSFARKPNPDGFSPIHLALQNGHTLMVRRLLQVDGDLVRVKGKEGRTPLHDVAATASTEQQLDLLFKFLSDCPNSIEDVTIQNQTALHIALENNNLVAFKRLVKWLRKNKSENAREILNRQDGEGNTVMQLAVFRNQTQAVRELRNCGVNFQRLRLLIKTAREGSRISNDDRNVLLVVAALLITITYQAVLSPPGGLWQDAKSHDAGTAIAGSFSTFNIVATINYITFTLSAIITFLLLPRGYISALFKMALVQLWVSYYYSLAVICESGSVLLYSLISTGLCFVLVLFAFFGRQFCGARIKRLHPDSIFYVVYAGIMFFMTFVMRWFDQARSLET